MNNELFIQPVQFEKVSYARVSENPAEWTGNVMERFYSQFPFFANSPVSVNLTEKDESRGYAMGSIKIEEGEGMVVPIVIQARELFPFDVCIVKGQVMPLTNTTLNLYIQSRGAFLRVVRPDAGDPTNALFNTSFGQQITPTYISDQYKTAAHTDEAHVPEQKAPNADAPVQLPKYDANGKKIVDPKTPTAITTDESKAHVTKTDAMGKKASIDASVEEWIKISSGGAAAIAEIAMHAGHAIDSTMKDTKIKKLDARVKSLEAVKTASEKDEDTKKHEKSESKAVEKKEDKKEAKQEKKASVIDKIAHTITEDMRHKFFATLSKNASVVEGFKRNDTQSVILKLASINPVTPPSFNDVVRKGLDRDIHYIYKAAAHDYRGIFGNSKVNDPVELSLDADAASKFESVKTPASYMSKEASYDKAVGLLNTNQGTIALFENMDYTILPPQVSTMQKMAQVGIEVEWFNSKAIEPELTKCAMWTNLDGPFEITRIYTDNGRERIETFNGLQKRAYCRMAGIDSPYTENGITYLPKTEKIVKLGNLIEVNERTLDNASYTNEVACIDNGAFLLKGAELGKLLKSSSREQDLHKTAWSVIQCGGTKNDVEKIASLKPGESYKINHGMHVPIEFDKVAQKMHDEYSLQVKAIRNITQDFIKEASGLTDTPTVDAVLSLNFVNRDNITEFANALPMFTDVSNRLADMLLKTRVGVRIVEENVLRRVMLGIVDIIDVLSGVANLASKK